jgi:hypothetical protein
MRQDEERGAEDEDRQPEDEPGTPGAEGGSGGSQDAPPPAPAEGDDSALGDTDQHSDAQA